MEFFRALRRASRIPSRSEASRTARAHYMTEM
jgi:hypothetical protein